MKIITKISSDVTRFLRFLIWCYQHTLSKYMGNQCRFTPTCSVYADDALRIHGPVKGVYLSVWRLCRCNPWGGHGYDPVPPKNEKK